jgi:hypothetical protein
MRELLPPAKMTADALFFVDSTITALNHIVKHLIVNRDVNAGVDEV